MKHALILTTALLAAACATAPTGPRWVNGEAPALINAAVETVVTTDRAVDADDPALWADRNDPSRALMFGTDKSDGLYVHNLDGSVRQFFRVGRTVNVDLREGFVVDGREHVLVVASNDQLMGVNTFLLDPATLETREWGFIATDMGEPYGICMGRRGDAFYVIVNNKLGEIRQYRISAGAQGPVLNLERTLRVGTQPEGCAVDDERDVLYVGEENVAAWSFDFDPQAPITPTQIAAIDGQRLTADVEGVTIMRDGDTDYLILSSQGDDTFPVYRIEGDAHVYVGRFAVVASETIDAVTESDGVDAWSGPIGPFPEGALAMHDTADAPTRGQQNYKLVDWRDVRRALGLQ